MIQVAAKSYSGSRISFSNGWIFNPVQDLLLFIAPFFITAFVELRFHVFSKEVFLPTVASVIGFMNMVHLGVTGYAAVDRYQTRPKLRVIILGLPVVVLLVGGFLFQKVSHQSLYVVLAYYAFLHVSKQQYGWLRISRRVAKEPDATAWIDTGVLFTLVMFPIIWWHSPLTTMGRAYSNPNDLYFNVTAAFALACQKIHWGIIFLYLLYSGVQALRGTPLNLSKYVVFFSTFLVFYGSIVVVGIFWFWWFCISVAHDPPYLSYVKRNAFGSLAKRSRNATNPIFRMLTSGTTAYLVSAVLIGCVLNWGQGDMVTGWMSRNFLPLFWYTILCHYALDSVVWRRPSPSASSSSHRSIATS